MNRILSIGNTGIDSADQLDQTIAAGLDLGDETAEPEAALESGAEYSKPSLPLRPEQADEEAERRRRQQAKATREQIVQDVERFNEKIRARVDAAHVTKFDLLRLRAMLTIIVAAGLPPSIRGQSAAPHGTSLQALPCDDSTHSWPRLVGRTLFTFFGTKRPAIRHLQIEKMHDQIPDDILECWATCFWAVQGAICASAAQKDLRRSFLDRLSPLARQI